MPQPVLPDGRLSMTGDAVVVALAGDTGPEVWTMAGDISWRRLSIQGGAGGLALVENMLAVHAARRDLAMLDANTGEIR